MKKCDKKTVGIACAIAGVVAAIIATITAITIHCNKDIAESFDDDWGDK